jgi:hypothetical protein
MIQAVLSCSVDQNALDTHYGISKFKSVAIDIHSKLNFYEGLFLTDPVVKIIHF